MSFLFPSGEITLDAALRDIASGKPQSRAAAAHALGDVTDPVEKRRAIDALVRALDDDHGRVRMEACVSLGELGDASVLPHLLKRLDDGEAPVRQHAAIALGTLRHPDGFEPLESALRDGPADLRFQAATSLIEIDAERAFEPVLAALADRDAEVNGAAALALATAAKGDAARTERARAALTSMLAHEKPSVRFDVAYSLAELADASGKQILAEHATDEERAWDAVTALAELRAVEELARIVGSKRTVAEARVLAAGKLLALGGGTAEPARAGFADGSSDAARTELLEALSSRKGNVRGVAVEQLAEVGGPWAKPALEKLARSGKASELVEAIAAAVREIDAREEAAR